MNLVGEWNELDKNQVQTPGESLESEHCSETDCLIHSDVTARLGLKAAEIL